MNLDFKDIQAKYPLDSISPELFQQALAEAYLKGISPQSNDKHENLEAFYDKEIAPLLKIVCDKCVEEKMPFVAVAEYALNETGQTSYLPTHASLAMVMLNHCAKTQNNIDAYIIGLLRYLKEKGIDYQGSIVMKQMAGEN